MSLQAYAHGALPNPTLTQTPFLKALGDFMQAIKLEPNQMPVRLGHGLPYRFTAEANVPTIYYIWRTGFPEKIRRGILSLPPRVGRHFFCGDLETRAKNLHEFATEPKRAAKDATRASLYAALHYAKLGEGKKKEIVRALTLASDIVAAELPERAECMAVAMKRSGDWLIKRKAKSLAQPFYISAAETIQLYLDTPYLNDQPETPAKFLITIDAAQYAGAAAFLGQDWKLVLEMAEFVGKTINTRTLMDENFEFLDEGAKEYVRAAYYAAGIFQDQDKAIELLTNAAFLFGRLSSVAELPEEKTLAGLALDGLMKKVVEPYRSTDNPSVSA